MTIGARTIRLVIMSYVQLIYLNLKKTKFPTRRAAINGSGIRLEISSFELKIGEEKNIDSIATKIPNRICVNGLFGVVIGSGSITKVKNNTVGSKTARFLLQKKLRRI